MNSMNVIEYENKLNKILKRNSMYLYTVEFTVSEFDLLGTSVLFVTSDLATAQSVLKSSQDRMSEISNIKEPLPQKIIDLILNNQYDKVPDGSMTIHNKWYELNKVSKNIKFRITESDDESFDNEDPMSIIKENVGVLYDEYVRCVEDYD